MRNLIILLLGLVCVAYAGKLDWRIVGGNIAETGQFPYEISLRYFGEHLCGGSILNDQWIVTAAHCVLEPIIPEGLTVVTGTNKLDTGGHAYDVENSYLHEGYNIFDAHNDIGLVRIKGTIQFTKKVQPIVRNTEFIGNDVEVVLSGWGLTNYSNDDPPNELQYIKFKTITSEDCNERHETSGTGLKVDKTQICTLTQEGKGACYGDSGSPLVANGKLVGLASWTKPCALGYPDVYTRVSKYNDWIDETMKNNTSTL